MDASEIIRDIAEDAQPPAAVPPVAYIRPVRDGAAVVYAVCAEDGTRLALFDSEEAAYYTARQHDLDATLIH